jgi:ABC-type multidrug transport system ATPase subunit
VFRQSSNDERRTTNNESVEEERIMGVLLKATGVAERPGRHRKALLQKINLTVAAGELVVIRGGSNTGKSALVELLAGLAQPGAGTIERSGIVALVSQQFRLYQDLTAEENLEFFSRINDYQSDWRALLTWAGLDRWPRKNAGQLPVGGKKMLQIGVALTQEPDLLILDEPTVGLDGTQTAAVIQLLQKLKQAGKGVALTLADAAVLAITGDQVYRLTNGTLVSEHPEAVPAARVEARQ